MDHIFRLLWIEKNTEMNEIHFTIKIIDKINTWSFLITTSENDQVTLSTELYVII